LCSKDRYKEGLDVGRAIAEQDRYASANHQLVVIGKIKRLPEPRQQREFEVALQPVLRIDAFDPVGNRLDEQVEVARHRIDGAAAQAVGGRLVAGDVEEGSQPCIAIQRHPVGDDLADGEQ